MRHPNYGPSQRCCAVAHILWPRQPDDKLNPRLPTGLLDVQYIDKAYSPCSFRRSEPNVPLPCRVGIELPCVYCAWYSISSCKRLPSGQTKGGSDFSTRMASQKRLLLDGFDYIFTLRYPKGCQTKASHPFEIFKPHVLWLVIS